MPGCTCWSCTTSRHDLAIEHIYTRLDYSKWRHCRTSRTSFRCGCTRRYNQYKPRHPQHHRCTLITTRKGYIVTSQYFISVKSTALLTVSMQLACLMCYSGFCNFRHVSYDYFNIIHCVRSLRWQWSKNSQSVCLGVYDETWLCSLFAGMMKRDLWLVEKLAITPY